jgi:hypothetical protein
MSKFTALMLFIVSLIIIGGFIPSLIGSFVDTSQPNKDSIVMGVVGFFKDIGALFSIIPPFSLISHVVYDYYFSMWNSYTFLPDWLSLPLLLIQFFLLLYVIVIGIGGS